MFKKTSLFMYAAVLVFAACSKDQAPDIQDLSKSYPIQSLEDEGVFNCTYDYSGNELQRISFNDGTDFQVQSNDQKIIQLNANDQEIINCEYNGNDQLTGFENLDEAQGIKQTFQIKYGADGYPSFVQCMQGNRDQYDKWSYQILYALEDITHSSEGAILSARFVSYLNSQPIDHFDLSFQTSGDLNPLYMNTTYVTSTVMLDYSYNLSKMSTRNVTRMNVKHSTNSNFDYQVNYSYVLDAEGLPSKITIQHPSVTRIRKITW